MTNVVYQSPDAINKSDVNEWHHGNVFSSTNLYPSANVIKDLEKHSYALLKYRNPVANLIKLLRA